MLKPPSNSSQPYTHPVTPNPTFLLVGSPAVGKSTTAKALAQRFAKGVHVPVDNLRDMVVSGLEMPALEWSDPLAQQVRLARESALFMAKQYSQAGFAVVLDDFYDPHGLLEYQRQVERGEIRGIILFPSIAEALRRNFGRFGDQPVRQYLDEGIRSVYGLLEPNLAGLRERGWMVLDTTEMSLEDAVDEILKL